MTDAPKKQHWLKFYSSDWRSDVTLGPCSLAARGLWMEMLCIMSEADPRGSLIKDGEPYTTKRLAALARASIKDVEKLVEELEQEGVFSRNDDGTIYSRRMRRDVEKANRDKANGSTGGNPDLNQADKHPNKLGVNPPDKAIETRSQKPEISLREIKTREAERLFGFAWDAYPRRSGHNPKKPARDRFVRLVVDGAEDPSKIHAGIVAYSKSREGQDAKFTKQTVVFLNQRGWEDDHQPPSPEARAGPNHRSADGLDEARRLLRARNERDHETPTERRAEPAEPSDVRPRQNLYEPGADDTSRPQLDLVSVRAHR